MSVLDVIRSWALQRPRWQQAALQMLYDSPSLSPDQLGHVLALCKEDAGLAGEVPPPPPLDLGGEDNPNNATATQLVGVMDVCNVNALLPAQSLSFSPAGLTLVFGDNGVGKTGYVRVLKQACRARGAEPRVHPNAFKDSAVPSSATIEYCVDGKPATPHTWQPGTAPPPALRQVSILDSRSAVVYVDGEQDIAYLPFGLDLFQRLSQVCDHISAKLETELGNERGGRDTFLDFPQGTEVREQLSSIHRPDARTHLSRLRTIAEPEAAAHAALVEEEATLTVSDPVKRADELALIAKRAQGIATRLSALATTVDEPRVIAVQQARELAQTSADTAAQVAEQTFGHFPLKGLSTGAWGELWRAAEAFASRGADPRQVFPPETGDLCVLCQQPVTAEAAARLQAFHSFVRDQLAASARSAFGALAGLIEALQRSVDLTPLTLEELEELNALSNGLGTQLEAVSPAATQTPPHVATSNSPTPVTP